MISKHLKKICDNLVKKHGIEYCLTRAYKLNEMNEKLMEDHLASGETELAEKVQKHINVNNKATEYLKQLQNGKEN